MMKIIFLINAQVLRLCNVFANNSSVNVKLSKAQLHKIEQSEEFLGRLSGPLIKSRFLFKNIL